ncbi:hypothetical protein ACMFMG_009462 [Clarireedia jacksonii]
MDDEPASDIGDYESDDGFVVTDNDDDDEGYGNDDDDDASEANASGGGQAITMTSSAESLKRASQISERPISGAFDSDDASLPDLSVIPRSTHTPSSALRPSSDTEYDSEEIVPPLRP